MEQAIAPTTTTPRRGEFQHANSVAGSIVSSLEQQPFAVEIEEDFPSGWRVHLKFRESRAAGLFEFAALVDVPVTRAETTFGVHLDAVARVETIEVRGSALVSQARAAELEGLPAPLPTPDASPAAQPVPLGASVLAQVPAITPVVPAGEEPPPDDEDGDDDAPRCVRCGCTEDAACEGGCSWVPNRQLIDLCSSCATSDEIAAMAHTLAGSEAVGGGR
ncbi:hypothetical protein [Streptomyces sp. NPDC050263]|uniref:hypothetical protein n=1 Tax=Streptomyces sp. NPDC050263 TaxID=3155037 RepID=UPI00341C99BE